MTYSRYDVNEALKSLKDGFTDLFVKVKRLENGCQSGLSAYGMCERRVDHEGKHWREDCGMWWVEDGLIHMERKKLH